MTTITESKAIEGINFFSKTGISNISEVAKFLESLDSFVENDERFTRNTFIPFVDEFLDSLIISVSTDKLTKEEKRQVDKLFSVSEYLLRLTDNEIKTTKMIEWSKCKYIFNLLIRKKESSFSYLGNRFQHKQILAMARDGNCTVNNIIDKLKIHKQRVSRITVELKSLGLIKEDIESDNGKTKLYTLTNRGIEACNLLCPVVKNQYHDDEMYVLLPTTVNDNGVIQKKETPSNIPYKEKKINSFVI